jgi:hypothetical protein
MSLLTKPQGRIPLAYVQLQGQRVPVLLEIEWDRFLDILTERAGGVMGTSTTEIVNRLDKSADVVIFQDEGADIEFIPGPPGPAADIDLATTITATTVISARSGTILVDTTAGNVTVTLPANGLVYRIKRITAGANTLTIATASGNIDDAATASLKNQYESVTLKSDGTDYWIV